MLDIYYTSKFKKDYKQIIKQGKKTSELEKVLGYLQQQKKLPEKYKDHLLTGNYTGLRECHINPDWLLIYKIDQEKLILALARTGSHSELF